MILIYVLYVIKRYFEWLLKCSIGSSILKNFQPLIFVCFESITKLFCSVFLQYSGIFAMIRPLLANLIFQSIHFFVIQRIVNIILYYFSVYFNRWHNSGNTQLLIQKTFKTTLDMCIWIIRKRHYSYIKWAYILNFF